MKNVWMKIVSSKYLQVLLYICINAIFIFKYLPRYEINPYLSLFFFILVISIGLVVYNKYSLSVAENKYKYIYFLVILLTLIFIMTSLILIDPYSIRVDRWSALTFFWDSIFSGKYPYGVHTHVSDKNFASPFPVWHLINIPFYLLKDVGYSIIFFFCLTSYAIYKYFESYCRALLFLILLLISPSYWWEILVRSDGLSNTLLVMMVILWYIRKNKSLSENLSISILICGLIAATRFTGLLPLAIFFFKPYLELGFFKKIFFPFSVLLIAFLSFAPFIFWDTDTWIFFSRNPLMSQTNNGDSWVLFIMFFVGIAMSLLWKTIEQFFSTTAFFISIFILTNQLVRLSKYEDANFFSDYVVDISYFTLAIPYCILVISKKFSSEKQIIE